LHRLAASRRQAAFGRGAAAGFLSNLQRQYGSDRRKVMAGLKSRRFIFGLALVLLALPAMAAAQSSTFVIDFNRTGTPGTATVTTIDPLTGLPTTMTVDTGAFTNPCTAEFVDVLGRTTISTAQSIDKFGNLKVNVSEVTKGTGAGWVLLNGVQSFTASTYAFNENSQFTFRLPPSGSQEFTSDFSDKLAMKGAKSIDNWVIRAQFRIKVSADGTVQVFMIKMNADNCKG
jgi:hypothetical protein